MKPFRLTLRSASLASFRQTDKNLAQMITIVTRRQRAQGFGPVGTATVVAGAAIAGAAIAIFGFSIPTFLLLGSAAAISLLVFRANMLLTLAILFAFVIAGIIRYFAATNAVANVAPVLLILLIIKAIFENRDWYAERGVSLRQETLRAPILYTFFFFLSIVFSSAFSHSLTSLALIFALKTYLPMAGLLLIAFVSRSFRESVFRLWNLLLAIAILQLPFVVYQHFFVARSRADGIQGPSWDAIVGTMGGNPDGGGSSGALAIFLSLCLIYVVNLVRFRLLASRWGIVLGTLVIVGIALAEVKIVFVLLPMGVAATFWSELKREPAKAFLILALGILGTLFVLFVYQIAFWEQSRLLGSDIMYNFSRSIEYMLDPNYFHARTGEVGRFAGLLLWWKDAWGDPFAAVSGNGPGASRLNNLYIGDIAKHYFPFTIDSTALVALLWDFGIVGTAAYMGTLLIALSVCVRRLRSAIPPVDAVCLHTAGIGIVFLLVTSIYNKDVLYLPQMSLLIAFCIATVLACCVPAPKAEAK